MLLRERDDRVWPMQPKIRSTLLRAKAAKIRRAAWAWWLTALAVIAWTLTGMVPEDRVFGIILALFPAVNGLRLFAVAQDLLDDSLDGDL